MARWIAAIAHQAHTPKQPPQPASQQAHPLGLGNRLQRLWDKFLSLGLALSLSLILSLGLAFTPLPGAAAAQPAAEPG
ncbi:MAG: hypothetical protein HC824_13605, partial [Synechococcales cyanobacterium RM1_1_8]|nr:hypothetical protein [Synechococcales cyanobacterium RM1_1_8]